MANDFPEKCLRTKALVVDKAGSQFTLEDVILDEVRANEVLVEMKYTGLCHTDIVSQHGLMPIGEFPAILGHEGAGVVRRIGKGVKDKSLRLGQTVLLSFNSCRTCDHCTTGKPGNCEDMTSINFAGTRKSDGSHPAHLADGRPARGQFFGQSSLSKHAIVHENSVIPCNVSTKDLAVLTPLGCGYQTGAGTIMNVLRPRTSTRLAIFGMGAVGFAALLAAKHMGVKVVVAVDLLESKLELAKSLGATELVNTAKNSDLAASISALGGVDQIVETTGVSRLISQGVQALEHAGKMVMVGVPRPKTMIEIDPLEFLLGCKSLEGVIEGQCNPETTIPHLIQLYKQGSFPVDRLAKVYDARCIDQAIEDLKNGSVIKPVLSWDNIAVDSLKMKS